MFWKYKKRKKVYVGLSGGVDSSVTAALLQSQGFEVVGVYIKGWYPEWVRCSWKESRRDAMRICAQLHIPFKTLDLSKEYKKEVVDYLLAEYQKGETPNPDIMCNKYIKFGGFFDWAIEDGANYIATGHYAQVRAKKNTKYELLRGKDTNKDQSYFLWTLTQKHLAKTLFPLGSLEKKRVRKLAKKYNLVTALKKDSQGVCFLEDINMEEFLKHYLHPSAGVVLNESGEPVGKHNGAVSYTIGQRHNFTITEKKVNDEPYYIISKDVVKNTLMVSRKPAKTSTLNSHTLREVNWVGEKPVSQKEYGIQMRYRQKVSKANLLCKDDVWSVKFSKSCDIPVRGQSLVVYSGDVCLGGGIIE